MGTSHPVGHQDASPGAGDRAKRARWFRRHPRLALLLVAVAFFLVLDVALGSALTLLRIHPIAPKSGSEYRVRHEVYHHTLRPGVECQAHWGPISYEMRTNSLGFRSAVPVDLPLQRNSARRILVIGDSFAEGVGVAFEDSFVGTLTEEFEAHGIEFLNAAVVSYSPTVYLAKVRHLLEVDGLRFDELVVCIDISDIEDEARFYTMDAEGRVARSTDSRLEEGVKGFIARQTLVMSALRSWFRTLRSRANEGVDVSRGLDRALWGSRQDLWEAYGRRGMRLATERMTELHALAERHGVEMTVAVYPWPDQILGRNTEHRQVQSWRAWCAERGVEFVNCFPAFLDDSDSESVIADCYIRGDVHWRREGHEKIAALLGARWR